MVADLDGKVHWTFSSTASYVLIEFSCVLRQFLGKMLKCIWVGWDGLDGMEISVCMLIMLLMLLGFTEVES